MTTRSLLLFLRQTVRRKPPAAAVKLLLDACGQIAREGGLSHEGGRRLVDRLRQRWNVPAPARRKGA